MSFRDSNPNRPRGWPSETIDSMEDRVAYVGNGGTQRPIREPNNAPPDARAQRDLGFARFRKKLASPTHQRVTAGGRIIPMKKRVTPSQFALENEGSPQNASAQETRDKDHINTAITAASNSSIGDEPRVNTAASQVAVTNDTAFRATSNMASGLGLEFLPSGMTDMGYGLNQLALSPILDPTQYGHNIAVDPVGMQPASMFYHGLVPMAAPTPLYPSQYSMMPFSNGLWSFADQNGVSGLQASLSTTFELEQLLSQANAEFEDLNQQLRKLDRRRAMNNYDPARAAQRVEIVDLRSKAKDNIRRIRIALKLEPRGVPPNPSVVSNRRLNVEAAVWVPNSVPKSKQSIPIQKQSEEERVVHSQEPTATANPAIVSARRDPFIAQFPPESPELEGVDEWGSRLGRAPPELERLQSEMLESMTSGRTSSPTSTAADDSVVQPSEFLYSNSPDKGKPDSDDGFSEASSDIAGWIPTNPGCASPFVELDYAMHMGALRKPTGITTHVCTSGGQMFAADGQDLKQPESHMTDFERQYWSQNPEPTLGTSEAGVHNQENSVADSGKMVTWPVDMDPCEGRYGGHVSTSRKGLVDLLSSTCHLLTLV